MSLQWYRQAACRGQASRLGNYGTFFIAENRRNQERVEREAKAFCARCPVKNQCLDYAISEEIIDGIWGGLTVDERDEFARSRAFRVA